MKKIILGLLAGLLVFSFTPFLFSTRKFNIILITVDTLRADYLSSYNQDAPPTPEIDSLAKHGTLFEQAFTLMPVTLPAHGSILTSRPPHELKLFDNGQVYRETFPTVSEILKKQGYATAAFVSLGVLKKKFGLNRGFDLYDDDLPRHWRSAEDVNGALFSWMQEKQKAAFFAWIHYSEPHAPYLPEEHSADTEFFFDDVSVGRFSFLERELEKVELRLSPGSHTVTFRTIGEAKRSAYLRKFSIPKSSGVEIAFGPEWRKQKTQTGGHWWYFDSKGTIQLINPNPHKIEVNLTFAGGIEQTLPEILKNYAAEVKKIDRSIGSLRKKLKDLGLSNKTIVVLTADHGEGLDGHGLVGHGFTLYNELLNVPLIIHHPFLTRTTRVQELADHLDLMPTILDLAHIDETVQMRGRSLAKHVTWEPSYRYFRQNTRRPLSFASTPDGVAPSFAVQDGQFKLLYTRRGKSTQYKAFDLSVDPAEKNSLFRTDQALFTKPPFQEWKTLLTSYEKANAVARSERGSSSPDSEDVEMLRALGYTAE